MTPCGNPDRPGPRARHLAAFLLLACACLWSAGEPVFAASAGKPGPLVESVCLAPGLVSAPPGGSLEALSVSARARLAWMQEGERRRYFPDQEPDSLLLRVETRLALENPGPSGRFFLGLPEPETGFYLGLTCGVRGGSGTARVLKPVLREFLESGGAPQIQVYQGRLKNGVPVRTERWISGGGEDGRGRSPSTKMGGRVYSKLYVFPLSLSRGAGAVLELSYYTFVHRQQNPPVFRRFNWGRAYALPGLGSSIWGRAPLGQGKASYFFDLALLPLRTFSASRSGACSVSVDLGRPIASRWLALKAPDRRFHHKQSVDLRLPLALARDLPMTISDAVLRHYPPMSLKQKEASHAMVLDAARADGRF